VSRRPRDDYYVLMYTFVTPLFSGDPERARLAIQRFREHGCNGGTLSATFVNVDSYTASIEKFGYPPVTFPTPEMGSSPFRENDFPFYVENIVRPIYWNWGPAKPLFREQYQAFDRDRDPAVFNRTPCLNDPEVMALMKSRVADVMNGLADSRDLSLLYDLRDEPSVTSFLLASDLCFCDHCMAAMREWLTGRYGELGALNAGWGTSFGSWDDVVPLTTQEALERREEGNWNFAPWADHRNFVNETFRRVCADLSDEIKAHDPEAWVGLAGTQCPSVFGGYDFGRLVPILDWAEPYDYGASLDLVRSFRRRREFPILKTDFLGGSNATQAVMLWTYLFQSGGYSGTIIYSSERFLDAESDDLTPIGAAPARRDLYAELRSGAARLLQATADEDSPVAVHYSHASVNADFIATAPNRWRSVAGYESSEYADYQSRVAWWKLLEDRGLRPRFLDTEQVEDGDLIDRDIRVFILPRSIALSDAEAAEIRRFVEAGGVLLADHLPGCMDERCRERESGVLDDLFGITRLEHDGYHTSNGRASYGFDVEPGARPKWGQGSHRVHIRMMEECIEPAEDVIVMGCSEMTDTPIGIVARRGEGRAVLFNASPVDYTIDRRLANRGRGQQQLFGRFIEEAGVQPLIQVFDAGEGEDGEPLPGWRAWCFRQGSARYYGLAPDMAVAQDVLGAITIEGAEGEGRAVRVRLGHGGHVYESRSGRYLGEGAEIEDTLTPTSVRLYAVLPYRVTEMALHVTGGVARAALHSEGDGQPGDHVFRFDVLDADGHRLLDLGANIQAFTGAVTWMSQTAPPPGGRIVCRDVATGLQTEATVG